MITKHMKRLKIIAIDKEEYFLNPEMKTNLMK